MNLYEMNTWKNVNGTCTHGRFTFCEECFNEYKRKEKVKMNNIIAKIGLFF